MSIDKDVYAAKVLGSLVVAFIIVMAFTQPHWQSYSGSIVYLDAQVELGTDGTSLYYSNGGSLTQDELRALEVLADHYEIHINE
jgi:hypothetical protein